MATQDDIPTPKIQIPKEIKDLIMEIKKTNKKIEDQEKTKKPSIDAEFIVKKFHKDMRGFEHAYAYLTEKLSDYLVDSFIENIIEIKLTNDILNDTRSIMHDIHIVSLESQGTLESILHVLKNNASEATKNNKKMIHFVQNMNTNMMKDRIAQAREAYLVARNKGESKEKMKENRTKAEAQFKESPGIMAGSLAMIGKLLGVRHIKSIAGFLGGIALGPGRWAIAIAPFLKYGLLGAGVYLAYKAVGETFIEMYQAYRNQGSTVVAAGVKALGESVRDMIDGTMRLLGLKELSNEMKQDTKLRRAKEKLEGEIEVIRQKIAELYGDSEMTDQMKEDYERLLRQEAEFRKKLNHIQKQVNDSRRFWFFMTEKQFAKLDETIPQLQAMQKEYHETFTEDLKNIDEALSENYKKRSALLRIRRRDLTVEQQLQLKQLELESTFLEARKAELKRMKGYIDNQVTWAETMKQHGIIAWEEITKWIGDWWEARQDWFRVQEADQADWEAQVLQNGGFLTTIKKNLIESFSKLFDNIKDMFNNWILKPIYDYILDPFNDWKIRTMKAIGGAIKSGWDSVTEIFTKIPEYFKSFFIGLKDRITGIFSSPKEPEKPILEKNSFLPNEQDMTPTRQTQMLKAASSVARLTQQLAFTNAATTNQQTVMTSNMNSMNVSAPTTIVAKVTPVNTFWSDFHGGTNRLGYGI